MQAKDQLNLLRSNIGLTQMLTYVRSNNMFINIIINTVIVIIRSINTLTADEEMTNVFGESDLLIWQKVKNLYLKNLPQLFSSSNLKDRYITVPTHQIKDKIPVRRTTDVFMAVPMPKKALQRFMFLVRYIHIILTFFSWSS